MYSQRSISFMTDDRRRICAEIRRWEPKFAVPQNHRHLGGAMDTLETKNKRPSRNGLIKCAIRACSQLGCALMPEDYRSVGDCASVCGCVCVCVCACVCVCVCVAMVTVGNAAFKAPDFFFHHGRARWGWRPFAALSLAKL